MFTINQESIQTCIGCIKEMKENSGKTFGEAAACTVMETANIAEVRGFRTGLAVGRMAAITAVGTALVGGYLLGRAMAKKKAKKAIQVKEPEQKK